MTKDNLKKAFDLMTKLNNVVDGLHDLGFDVIDTPLYEVAGMLFDMVIESNYTEEGQDWINWFYFEKDGNPEIKAFDENENEICRDFDELYEYVKQFDKNPK